MIQDKRLWSRESQENARPGGGGKGQRFVMTGISRARMGPSLELWCGQAGYFAATETVKPAAVDNWIGTV
jgi:hypothetical protein